jgi:transcriptional regulator with XRE-family HTH domain
VSTSRLAYWRKRRGLTQEQLAALAGVAQPAISEMERALRAPKGLYTAFRLAAACGTTVEAIWPDVCPRPAKRQPATTKKVK